MIGTEGIWTWLVDSWRRWRWHRGLVAVALASLILSGGIAI
jgi:hypothetical protein